MADLVRGLCEGEEKAVEGLISLVYPELHRLAAAYLRGERRNHTLQPTALVNEAYLRLVGGAAVEYADRVHFLAVAARTMRRVLVDHAKARGALKRGGDRLRVTLTDARVGAPVAEPDVVALDDAMSRLAERDGRKGQVIELHFFGGLTYEEIAEVLGVSPATVNRDLSFAKAWLADDLESEGG